MIQNIGAERIKTQYSVDDSGYMKIAMNALLIAHGGRVVLIDPGCGDFLPKRILDDYGLEIPLPPEELLMRAGYAETDITDVVFTHLHFDHGTAAFKRVPGNIIKRYEKAKYWVSEMHYNYAMKPVESEKNSFFAFVFRYMDAINWLENWDGDWLRFGAFHGHTKGMVVPRISGADCDLVFASDLLPLKILTEQESYSFYDIDSGLQMKEKEHFLRSLERPTLVLHYHEPDEALGLYNGGSLNPEELFRNFS